VNHFKHFVESSDFCVVDLQGNFFEGWVVQKIFRERFDLPGPLDPRMALRGLAQKILEIFHYCKFFIKYDYLFVFFGKINGKKSQGRF
jgi:hypothetical protein